jgi:hypothetical protein
VAIVVENVRGEFFNYSNDRFVITLNID